MRRQDRAKEDDEEKTDSATSEIAPSIEHGYPLVYTAPPYEMRTGRRG